MANIYVRSTDGNNSDDGSTWALAKAALVTGALLIDAAGDTIFVSQSHSESGNSISFGGVAGTRALPTKILCVNDSAEPPTTLSTGASFAGTGTFGGILMSTAGTVAYLYGLSLEASGGSSVLNFGSTTVKPILENCALYLNNATATGNLFAAEAVDCTFRFTASGLAFELSSARIVGGALHASTGAPTAGYFIGQYGRSFIQGFDFSPGPTSANLASAGSGNLAIVNCKLPASWSGSLGTNLYDPSRIGMYNCDNGDTNFRLWVATAYGSIRDETTLVRSGGASDGATPIAWKMTTLSGVGYPASALMSDDIVRWNETIGSAITVTVEILHDPGSPGSLNDDEIWLEVQYLGTSGVPLGSFIEDVKADVIAASAPQASSSATWTTTGLSNPTTQKLSVTFTPQEIGFIHAVVKMAKPSYTVYVCPKLDVT